MHVSGDSRDRRPRYGVLVLLALVALLAVVAIASAGHVPIGTSNARRPSHELADAFLSLLVVFVLVGGLGIFYVYYLQRTNTHEERRKGRAGGNRRTLMFAITFMALLIGLAVRAAVHNRNGHQILGLSGGALPTGMRGGKDSAYTPQFAPVPVAVVLGATGMPALSHICRIEQDGERFVRSLSSHPWRSHSPTSSVRRSTICAPSPTRALR